MRSDKTIALFLLFCFFTALSLSSLRAEPSSWSDQQELSLKSSCPKKRSDNVPRRILELRNQRPHMVSSTAQCQAIYRAVSRLPKHLLQPETLPGQGEGEEAALAPSS